MCICSSWTMEKSHWHHSLWAQVIQAISFCSSKACRTSPSANKHHYLSKWTKLLKHHKTIQWPNQSEFKIAQQSSNHKRNRVRAHLKTWNYRLLKHEWLVSLITKRRRRSNLMMEKLITGAKRSVILRRRKKTRWPGLKGKSRHYWMNSTALTNMCSRWSEIIILSRRWMCSSQLSHREEDSKVTEAIRASRIREEEQNPQTQRTPEIPRQRMDHIRHIRWGG